MKVFILYPKADDLKLTLKSRKWCRLPYPGHNTKGNMGCPRYGKKGCPPKCSTIKKTFNLKRKLCLVIVRFNLKEHTKRMKKRHPEWSEKQARCLLYWQGTMRKRIKETVRKVMKKNGFNVWTERPEAMGMNVISTCRLLGIPIKRNPQKFIFKVALVGFNNSKTLFNYGGK